MADRIGTISERQEFGPIEDRPLSYRASLLINLAVSAALYGLGYLVLREAIHLVGLIFH